MPMTNIIRFNASATNTLTIANGTISSTASIQATDLLANADAVFSYTGTLSSSSMTFDLRGGTLLDTCNRTLNLQTVYLVFFKNNTSGNLMKLGGANQLPLTDGTTNKINVAAGAAYALLAPNGITVTADTGDLIIVNGASGDAFELMIIGKQV